MLDRTDDHYASALEAGATRDDAVAPMTLFLAWATSREQGVELADVLAPARAAIAQRDSLDAGDLYEPVREFAQHFYGREYFDLLRSVFRTAYPALDDLDRKQLALLGKHLDRARAAFTPDPDRLTPGRALGAIRDAGAALLDGTYAWNSARAAFVHRAGASGEIVLELRPQVLVADRRYGQTGVRLGGLAAVCDERVERVAALIPDEMTTRTLRFPLLRQDVRAIAVPHAGKLAEATRALVGELATLVPWLETYRDERTILDAFPIQSGPPAWKYGDAAWLYRRGLFAIVAGLESIATASAVFAEVGKRDRYWRTLGSRELWNKCVAALSQPAAGLSSGTRGAS